MVSLHLAGVHQLAAKEPVGTARCCLIGALPDVMVVLPGTVFITIVITIIITTIILLFLAVVALLFLYRQIINTLASPDFGVGDLLTVVTKHVLHA